MCTSTGILWCNAVVENIAQGSLFKHCLFWGDYSRFLLFHIVLTDLNKEQIKSIRFDNKHQQNCFWLQGVQLRCFYICYSYVHGTYTHYNQAADQNIFFKVPLSTSPSITNHHGYCQIFIHILYTEVDTKHKHYSRFSSVANTPKELTFSP